MSHLAYVAAAYIISMLAIAGLVAWILLDQSAQQRALKELESRGVRRRSAGGSR
ncbi:heme exporter protein CcmD [Chelativorans sp. AA-79]|uniref:heme exporter protein CcmD n=1 Tax=Chelativorans sp. AA-79 TaxID=3028735 RepID=UPI0023F7A48E|nr:heme exporter protein CcmD [Chelativorans sp. AA-79]WEX09862.1 heme exporter protein CcmD [Chelativorans sp. AA-79]